MVNRTKTFMHGSLIDFPQADHPFSPYSARDTLALGHEKRNNDKVLQNITALIKFLRDVVSRRHLLLSTVVVTNSSKSVSGCGPNVETEEFQSRKKQLCMDSRLQHCQFCRLSP